MRRAPGRAGGLLHIVTGEPRRHRPVEDWDFGPPLEWPDDPDARPYLDAQGNLVLPINAPKRFRWWAGQSVSQTMR